MDANEIRGQPRLPLQRAVDWILSECGTKILDERFVYGEKDDGDGDKFRNYSKEYSRAALRAVNELLGKIHDGQLKARGYPDGDASRGRKEIPADEFPDTATDSPYGVSLEVLLPSDQPKRHLVFEDSAQLRYFRTVYWSGIVISGDDVLRLWPFAAPSQSAQRSGPKPGAPQTVLPRVIEEMRRDIASGEFDLANAKEVELEHRYQASRDTCRRARDVVLQIVEN